MHKDILTAIIRGDETPSLRNIEPLPATFALTKFGFWYCNSWPMGSWKSQSFKYKLL
jgi:hypothetical protein